MRRASPPEKLAELMEVKNHLYARISDYAERVKANFLPDMRPWHVPVDVALPCATQNELNEEDAATLIKNGVICVAEGANMPSTAEAVKCFERSGILFAPGQSQQRGRRSHLRSGNEPERHASFMASGRGGCALARNHAGYPSDPAFDTADAMTARISYVNGANVAGFVKVADAMIGQGVI